MKIKWGRSRSKMMLDIDFPLELWALWSLDNQKGRKWLHEQEKSNCSCYRALLLPIKHGIKGIEQNPWQSLNQFRWNSMAEINTWMVAQTAAARGTQFENGTTHRSTNHAKRPSGIRKGSKGCSTMTWLKNSRASLPYSFFSFLTMVPALSL